MKTRITRICTDESLERVEPQKGVKIALPATHMTADEFIRLLDAAVFSENEERAEAAAQELKSRKRELDAVQQKYGAGPESKN